MESTYENKATLQLIIDNLQSQIDSLYYTNDWDTIKSEREESLVNMISLLADQRNKMEYELSLEEDYGQAYLRSQI
jgi:hypothetical protein